MGSDAGVYAVISGSGYRLLREGPSGTEISQVSWPRLEDALAAVSFLDEVLFELRQPGFPKHFFIGSKRSGHVWYGLSALCGQPVRFDTVSGSSEMPAYLCSRCVRAAGSRRELFLSIFGRPETDLPGSLKGGRPFEIAALRPTPEELQSEGVILLWSEKLGEGIITSRLFWPGFMLTLSRVLTKGLTVKISKPADDFIRRVTEAGLNYGDLRAALLDVHPRGQYDTALMPSSWSAVLASAGVRLPPAGSIWFNAAVNDEGIAMPIHSLSPESLQAASLSIQEWHEALASGNDWRKALPAPVVSIAGRSLPASFPKGCVTLRNGDRIQLIPFLSEWVMVLRLAAGRFRFRRRFADLEAAIKLVDAILGKGGINPVYWEPVSEESDG